MTDRELAFTPAWELAERMRKRDLSPVEVTEYFLRRIEALDGQLNAFLTVCGDEAMAQAREAEAALSRGDAVGPLHGLPVPIKDLNATKGVRTTRGSRFFKDEVPDEDDIIVERVKAAGGIIIGKTNTPEFGHRGTTENMIGEPCRNPWNVAHTPGGSSGGAAAAVAAGLSPIATGSDGGGSIRIPASFSGIFGIKPTQGRVARLYPTPGGWGQFGQNGPMSRNVRDSVLLFQALAGPDPRDPTALQEAVPNFSDALDGGGVKGLRIGWSADYGYNAVDPEVVASVTTAVGAFTELGAHVEEVVPPIDGDTVFETFRTLFASDNLANVGALLDSNADDLTPSLRRMLETARTYGADRIMRALHELEWHRARMDRFFDDYDLLLSPTMAVPAFRIEEFPDVIGGRSVDPMWGYTPFTYPINMSGQTASSVPCGFSSGGLPIGLHIIGPKGAEVRVLRASAAFEAARPWAHLLPPVS